MRILGLNMGYSQPKDATPSGLRHHLSDGSSALLDSGELVFAGIEERYTRHRYQGGFGNTICAFWGSDSGEPTTPVDAVAISSCCGPRWTNDAGVREEIGNSLPPGLWNPMVGAKPNLIVVDHHESHAALGFSLSGADRAVVAVIDGFGNLIDSSGWNPEQWWRGRFQRHSYFLAQAVEGGFNLRRVDHDAENFDDVGLGEAYRAITHFCGWNSYQHAGSTMALSAFGDPNQFRDVSFVRCVENEIACSFSNNHPEPAVVVEDVLSKYGVSIPSLREKTASTADTLHCSVVRAVQDQLTEALCERLIALSDHNQVNTIIVAGGVAMNCLAMGQLQRRFSGRVFIAPAPSDTGQGLGNAIWTASCASSPLFNRDLPPLNLKDAPFWGVPTDGVQQALRRVQGQHGIRVTTGLSEADQFACAAQLLASGQLVAVCMGRAEYGPRALGRRSVLFDPRRPDAVETVNRFKRREPYRPFAPAILSEMVTDFFSWEVRSPFMSFAVQVKPNVRNLIPGVVHADGTARVQTVDKDSNSPLRPILDAFAAITGIPVLLNTSFNRRGEPIIETPVQAVDAFLHSSLDAVLLDGAIVHRIHT